MKCSFLTNLIAVSLLLILYCGCFNDSPSNSATNKSVSGGKSLAAVYCASCHQLPDPSLLDAATWQKKVLPAMGPRLGIFSYNFTNYPIVKDTALPKGYYPSKPALTYEEWQSVIQYYISAAPHTLNPSAITEPTENQLPFFQLKYPRLKDNNAATGFITIDTSAFSGGIIFSDLLKHKMYFVNKQLNFYDSVNTSGPVVNLQISASRALACNIGYLNPTNRLLGNTLTITKSNHHFVTDTAAALQLLPRPVQVISCDLNKDGITDYLVCGFGYLTGSFFWLEGKPKNTFEKHVLSPLPGAIKAYIKDFNGDGLPDIAVLMAHAQEEIAVYMNAGNNRFEKTTLLTFPPVYGSSYFEFADFDKDGHDDILYTCGDNGDYSPILKPYHGIYIFLNDGNMHFTQSFFYPMNGCYKAVARDFDKDGKLDIAAISFFADYAHHPENGFVFLKNKGNLTFKSYTSTQLNTGRWLVMDAQDYDGDGKTDIVLGNCFYGPVMQQCQATSEWKKASPFVVLKNIFP